MSTWRGIDEMTPLDKALCGLETAIEKHIAFNDCGFSYPGHPQFVNNAMLRASFNVLKQEAERIQAVNTQLVEAATAASAELENHKYYQGVENSPAVDAVNSLDDAIAHAAANADDSHD